MNAASDTLEVAASATIGTQIRAEIIRLFSDSREILRGELVNAFVPFCPFYEPGKRALSIMSYRELEELKYFCDRHNSLIRLIDQGAWPHDDAKEMATRWRMAVYCHIMESDFPLLVIMNLLRLADDLDPTWAFFCRDKVDDSVKLDVEGNPKTLEKRHQKFEHLGRYSNAGALPDLLLRLWNSELRNAYAHSQYAITQSGNVAFSKYWTGATGQTAGLVQQHQTNIMHGELNTLHAAAVEYFASFFDEFAHCMHQYTQGKPVQTRIGKVRFDNESGNWIPAR